MTLTFGSLFAGIGGFDLGFERSGMECRWQVEIDEYATKVLEKHWPHVRRWPDVRTWPQDDTERVDVICGGFPCQDISYAGKGAGLKGERSGLFFEAMRVIRELGPGCVVLENVAALLTRGLSDVLGSLASIGYDTEWHCIPAAAVGAPHIRDRVFIIAILPNTVWLERKSGRRRRVWTGNKVLANSENANRRENSLIADSKGSDSGQQPRGTLGGRASRNHWWTSEPALDRVANGVPRRMDRNRGLGNAVVPQVAQWIGERIIESDNRRNSTTEA